VTRHLGHGIVFFRGGCHLGCWLALRLDICLPFGRIQWQRLGFCHQLRDGLARERDFNAITFPVKDALAICLFLSDLLEEIAVIRQCRKLRKMESAGMQGE
jgi:hypothetical protein